MEKEGNGVEGGQGRDTDVAVRQCKVGAGKPGQVKGGAGKARVKVWD